MKLAKALSESDAKRVQSLVLLGGVITTLAIWTNLEDPINLPKMFVLVLFAAAVLGLVSQSLLQTLVSNSRSQKLIIGLLGLLTFCLFISTLATDVRFTAIFGEFHRNNGFLSYLSMIVMMAAASVAFGPKSAEKYFKFYSAVGILTAIYGLMQSLGQDPVNWVIEYNPVITTLGNPNFTSGLLGLSGIATFYLLLVSKSVNNKLVFGSGLILTVFTLVKSGSIQGLVGFAIGVLVILLAKAWTVNKKFGQFGLVAAVLGALPVVLAALNIGPLASKIYQGTLRNRLDYWNAAIGMFKDHPIFGVGIDRFGEYYRQYAVQNQVVQGQVTDNAHSIYMQLLATGGLVLFIPYILLIAYVTIRGFRLLISSKDLAKVQVAAIFGIWLATITVNLVTVDNLGVGVWFWISGGVLLGLSLKNDHSPQVKNVDDKNSARRSNPKNSSSGTFPFTQALAGSLALIMLTILVPLLNSSANLKQIKETQPGSEGSEYMLSVKALADKSRNNQQNLLQLSVLAFRGSDVVTGDSILNRIFELDARSFYAHYFRAFTLESLDKRSEAIPYRERLKELDPWNNTSLIELIKDYLSIGDIASAKEIVALIKQNYPGSQSDIEASALLVE
jgi:O-antigen ligase